MSLYDIKLGTELTSRQKEEAVALFVDGFKYLLTFAKSDEELHQLMLDSLDFSLIYICLVGDEVGGILGIGSNKKRPFSFEEDLCIKLFGSIKGRIICKQLNAIFTTPAVKGEKDLYIDFLTTAKTMRGKGIATMLLEFAFLMPEYETAYIEVLSKNMKAKALYEKIGFVVEKKSYNLFMLMQGFGYPIKMMRDMR